MTPMYFAIFTRSKNFCLSAFAMKHAKVTACLSFLYGWLMSTPFFSSSVHRKMKSVNGHLFITRAWVLMHGYWSTKKMGQMMSNTGVKHLQFFASWAVVCTRSTLFCILPFSAFQMKLTFLVCDYRVISKRLAACSKCWHFVRIGSIIHTPMAMHGVFFFIVNQPFMIFFPRFLKWSFPGLLVIFLFSFFGFLFC